MDHSHSLQVGRYDYWRAGHSACAKHCPFQRALGAHDCGMERLGTLDLVVAVGLGITSAAGSPLQLIHAGVGSQAMQYLPLSLVPTVLVPFYLLTHAIVAAQLRVRSRAVHTTLTASSAQGSLDLPLPLLRRRHTTERVEVDSQRKRRYRGARSVAAKSRFHSAEESGWHHPSGRTEYARIGVPVRVYEDSTHLSVACEKPIARITVVALSLSMLFLTSFRQGI